MGVSISGGGRSGNLEQLQSVPDPDVADQAAFVKHLCDETWDLLVIDVFIEGENTLEHLNEFLADDLALLLRVGHPRQLAHEVVDRIDADDLDTEVAGEHLGRRHGLIGKETTVPD